MVTKESRNARIANPAQLARTAGRDYEEAPGCCRALAKDADYQRGAGFARGR